MDLIKTADRPVERTPDFAIKEPRAWIEAIAPGPGRGSNRVVQSEPGVVVSIPDDQIKLRLTHAIFEKCKKHEEYINRGLIEEEDPYVIAINARDIPWASKEITVPRIVRALFGIGHEIVLVDTQTGAIQPGGHGSQPTATKGSGHDVPMTIFLDKRSAAVSAVIYSCVNAQNYPERIGSDILIVHNPQAKNKIDRDLIPCPRECIYDGGTVQVAWR